MQGNGIVITANHLGMVLRESWQYEIEKTIRMRLKFSTEIDLIA